MGDEVRLLVGDLERPIAVWPFRVGRAEHCELVVTDVRLARVQLAIDQARGGAGGWSIAALGPAPVRVNGIQVDGDLALSGGDRIECGSFHAVFLAPEPGPKGAVREVNGGVLREAVPVTAHPPAPRTRRFITTGGVTRPTRPPRAPAALAVGMALLVAGATGLFATAVHQMSAGDQAVDPRYAVHPIDIAARPPRAPEVAAPAAPPPSRPEPEAPEASPEREPEPTDLLRPAQQSTPLPPFADRAGPGTSQSAKAEDLGHGEARSPECGGSGARDGSVVPPGDAPSDPGGSGELRIPILGEEVWGKNIAFVVDRSGSMAPLWIGVRNELVATLRLLTPDHRFSLVLYSNELTVMNEGWTPGTPAMIERAIAWTEGVPARGATDPEPAVEHALRLPGIEALVLMSDIRFKGARMDRTVELLRRATLGTKSFKAIKLYFFPLEENESTARISALSSGSPSAAFRLRNLRR